jgi:hypothetical protein
MAVPSEINDAIEERDSSMESDFGLDRFERKIWRRSKPVVKSHSQITPPHPKSLFPSSDVGRPR